MFRCITELKGLAIDVDSFHNVSIQEWEPFISEYKCIFLTASDIVKEDLKKTFGGDCVVFLPQFLLKFAPSVSTHRKVLISLGLNTTEVAYVSENADFIKNAMEFLSGTVWVTDTVDYENASKVADIVVRDLLLLKSYLKLGVKGFLGEAVLFPEEKAIGNIVPVSFLVDEVTYPLMMLGRYFGYSHYMAQLHPYSSAIYLNKRRGKKYYGVFDEVFSALYLTAVKRLLKSHGVYGICSVPSRPGENNRFSNILTHISKETGIVNLGEELICKEIYSTQKSLSQTEREENVKNVFEMKKVMNGENVIIIDDIVSTGATLRECIRTMKSAGAGRIDIIVLAVNQIQETYWSSIPVQVSCPHCGEKMRLLVNSRNRSFFYSCFNCRSQTIDFKEGRESIVDLVNHEMKVSTDGVSL